MLIDISKSTTKTALKAFFAFLKLLLDEKRFRLLLGAFVIHILGDRRGAVSWLSEVTGASRNTISKGKTEILSGDEHVFDKKRVRRRGGGRKKVEDVNPEIKGAVKDILGRESYCNPQDEKGRLYSAVSLEKLKGELLELGRSFKACSSTLLRLVKDFGYTKQQNKKALQCGKPHPDRNEQMETLIDTRARVDLEPENPAISVDTKAKVPLGYLFTKGRKYRKKKDPEKVEDHDFTRAKAVPYGIYDIVHNLGFVNVGVSRDTAQFAVESIRRWWNDMGAALFPNAQYLTVLCDGGGSNRATARLWKYELAKLAEEIGMPIVIQHYPPGCSKYNLVEHRLFNQISINWAGAIFYNVYTVLRYICTTKTSTGLKVKARLDDNVYEAGINVSDEELESIDIVRADHLGAWNYMIRGFRTSSDRDGRAA